EVTSVPAGPLASSSLAMSRLRFVPGQGVSAEVSLPDDRGARLDLFDLAGRRVSSNRLDGFGTGDRVVTLPGTADLSSGLYFARLTGAGGGGRGKVSIAR